MEQISSLFICFFLSFRTRLGPVTLPFQRAICDPGTLPSHALTFTSAICHLSLLFSCSLPLVFQPVLFCHVFSNCFFLYRDVSSFSSAGVLLGQVCLFCKTQLLRYGACTLAVSKKQDRGLFTFHIKEFRQTVLGENEAAYNCFS